MRFRFLSLYLVLVFLLFWGVTTFFADKANASSPESINMSMVPNNPAPNQNTTINLNSYADDLNSVPISWYVGGKKVSSGVGDTSFSLNAPALGSGTTVLVTVSLPSGDIQKTIVVRPSVMVLLWQANDSYVPPFYKGKAMPSSDSQIKVVALPQIKNGVNLIDPKNMTYSWQLDSTNDQGSSGYSKNSFLYTSDYLDSSNNVDVTATTIDQNSSTEGNINISTTDPKIEFYRNDPDMGTNWDQALSDGHQIQGNEIIQAAPYFISPEDIRIPFLTFSWFINDMQIAVSDLNKNLLPLTAQAGSSGTSTIKLNITSSNKITETATRVINVTY